MYRKRNKDYWAHYAENRAQKAQEKKRMIEPEKLYTRTEVEDILDLVLRAEEHKGY